MPHHVTIAREGRWKLFDTEPAQRAAVRAVCRSYGTRLLLYCVVDDHIHAVVRGDRAEVGRATAGLQHVLRRTIAPRHLPGPFTEPARIRPVANRKHLEHLVGYVIGQPTRHGLGVPPARWRGSCFQDLVGARIVGGFDNSAIIRELPRLTEDQIWGAAGLCPMEPVSIDQLGAFGSSELVRAACAVYLASPELRGRSPAEVAARGLTLGLLQMAGHSAAQAARIVGCTPRSARNHRRTRPDGVRAALLQLALASALPERVPVRA